MAESSMSFFNLITPTTQQQRSCMVLMWLMRVGLILAILWLMVAETALCALAAEARVYESNQVDPKPVLQKAIRIRLPFSVRKRGGEITLRFRVTKEGKVDDITVVKFSDSDLIDPVYSAYEKATYLPGLKNGVPVDTWVTVMEKAE
jgi:hypothetical protein